MPLRARTRSTALVALAALVSSLASRCHWPLVTSPHFYFLWLFAMIAPSEILKHLKRQALQALNRSSSEKLFFPIDDRATLLEALNRRGAVMRKSRRQMALSNDQCPIIRSGEVERWSNLILISLSIASSHLLDGDSKPQLVFEVLATINCQQEARMGCRKIFSQCQCSHGAETCRGQDP